MMRTVVVSVVNGRFGVVSARADACIENAGTKKDEVRYPISPTKQERSWGVVFV